MASTAVERILDQLNNVKTNGQGWTARCPAHPDRTNSLSLHQGDDGRVLVKCFAGCSTQAIVAAIGLEMRDLFPPEELCPSRPTQAASLTGAITVDDLASDKRLPSSFLRGLGLTDRHDGVVIPYQLADGSRAPRQRLRTSVKAKEGSIWLFGKGPLVPYGLARRDEALKTGELTLVEGESDAWTAWFHGVHALGIPGAAMACVLRAEHLGGIRRLYVLQEPDRGGETFLAGVAKRCREVGWHGEMFVLSLPPGLKDLNDLHKQDPAGFTASFQKAVQAAKPVPEMPNVEPGARDRGRRIPHREQTQAERLVGLAETVELFHDPHGEGYATFQFSEHLETWPIKGRSFRRFLVHNFYENYGRPPSTQSIQSALALLEARAAFDGEERRVFLRVADHGGSIFLDLGNSDWDAVMVTGAGFQIVKNPPVRFIRAKGMAALPHPVSGATVQGLRGFLNISGDNDWRLMVAWLVAALRPTGPYPVLVLNGEHGSAKSTAARVLRALCDPNTTPLRAEPREARDLMIAATNSWSLVFDNVSHVPPWLSDAICRLATGGGFGTRELFTDADEMIFSAQRPVLLNGIEEIVTRSDLLDRSIIISLPMIPETQRREEAVFWNEFEKARPSILGALLTAVSAALANLSGVNLPRKPRMADFAVWVTAAESGLGWKPGLFLQSYSGNREAANDLVLEASPVAAEVRVLGDFDGTASGLLDRLDNTVPEIVRKQARWPKTPTSLSGLLRRIAPNLRSAGVDVTFSRDATATRRRIITIRKIGDATVQGVQSVQPAEFPGAVLDVLDTPPGALGRSDQGSYLPDSKQLDGPDGLDARMPPSDDDHA
jgi:hypothetical protein